MTTLTMTDPILWTLVFMQMVMGLFDVLYHHEFTERLAWRPSAARELALHAARNMLYCVLFLTFAWAQPHGWFAILLGAILVGEILITLWDFVEEDLSRALPATERVTHTLLALNYGAILAYLLPILMSWAQLPTALIPVSYGAYGLASALLSFTALGVFIFALRDYAASRRAPRLKLAHAKELAKAFGPAQHILITGGTGFIGTRLIEALNANGHHITLLTRRPNAGAALAMPLTLITDLDQLSDDTQIDIIINLAGEPVAGGLWTKARRAKLINSRVEMTQNLIQLAARLKQKPHTLLNASATGVYGLRGDEILTEADPGKPCFSHEICARREAATHGAQELGLRNINLRIGLVLGSQGGFLANMLPAFEFGLGGRIGDGMHWLPWIERDDLIRLICHILITPQLDGPINAVAPNPVRNKTFAKALGKALHRPAILPVPGWALRLALGDFANELLLRGQRVVPQKALASGFIFQHETIESALAYCVAPNKAASPTPPLAEPPTAHQGSSQ